MLKNILELVKIPIRKVRQFSLALSTLISGHQHQLIPYLYSLTQKMRRNSSFKTNGWRKFQLTDPEFHRNFKNIVDEKIKAEGALWPTPQKWALNNRVNLDCSKGLISTQINEILKSNIFQSVVKDILGGPYKIQLTQIWRNYPEDYNIKGKEVNSTYYHVDNGGGLNERSWLNIFYYLSEVNSSNGPFTFYTPAQTKYINRFFISDIFRFGNLRTRKLVDKIENLVSPYQLNLNPGEAVIIDNQVCLHRAGFCNKGYRDILQIIVEPS